MAFELCVRQLASSLDVDMVLVVHAPSRAAWMLFQEELVHRASATLVLGEGGNGGAGFRAWNLGLRTCNLGLR